MTTTEQTARAHVTDYALRSVRWTIVEEMLDRADLTGEQLREKLTRIALRAGWEQPGVQVEHVIECHTLWLEAEAEADSRDAEDRADRLHWRLDQAIRDLVTGR